MNETLPQSRGIVCTRASICRGSGNHNTNRLSGDAGCLVVSRANSLCLAAQQARGYTRNDRACLDDDLLSHSARCLYGFPVREPSTETRRAP